MPHRVIASFSMYSMIQPAVNHPDRAKDVVEHLANSRTLCLAMLFGLFVYHAHRAADQVLALSAIVVTLCIGALYDGLDSESFEAHIISIGVFGFTVMNSIPNLVTAGLLTCDLVALRFMQRTRGT
ncbi:hypothetical protein C8J56DRAFT_944850 [Mycena floridula]|nr:hypothetical protein C8J56DRAFT_944850 [Mycena floridula]